MDIPVTPAPIASPRLPVRDSRRGVLSTVRALLAGLCLVAIGLIGVPATVLAQQSDDPQAAPPVYTPDARTLDRVQSGVEADTPVTLDTDRLTFYLSVTESRPTFADYLRGTGKWFEISPIEPPSGALSSRGLAGGAGIDLLSIFRSMNRALEERKARQIRRQIDSELDAIQGRRTR